MAPRWLALLFVLLALPGCGGGRARALDYVKDSHGEGSDLKFVRDGVTLPATGGINRAVIQPDLQPRPPVEGVLYGDTLFVPYSWPPGEKLYAKHMGTLRAATAPLRPTPWPLGKLRLENVKSIALSGNLADSCVAVAGTTVAVGTYTGRLHIAEIAPDAEPLNRVMVEGGMVKSLAFPPENPDRAFPPKPAGAQPETLYLGEQSPHGRLRALKLPSLEETWGFDVSDDLGQGKLPGPEDPYGIYSLPGVFQIITRGNTIFAVGVRSYTDESGAKVNRSRLYAYRDDGTRLWAWPKEGPLPLNILRFEVAAGTLLLATSRSWGATEDPAPWLDRAVYVLDPATGIERGHLQIPKLPNFKDEAFIWQSVGITGDGQIGAIGLSDGRGLLLSLPTSSRHPTPVALAATLLLGMPIETAGVTLTAPVSYALCRGDTCYFQTAGSNIPPGGSDSATTPPAPHPGANTLTAVHAPTAQTIWSYTNPAGFNGLFSDALGRWLLTTTGNPLYADQSSGYGLLLFDTFAEGAGAEKVAWQQPLEGAPFFNAAISADGFFIAVTETPLRNPDGVSVRGTYQTHVFH